MRTATATKKSAAPKRARRTRPDPTDVPLHDEPDPGDDGLGNFEDEPKPTRSVIKADYKRDHVPDELGQKLSRATVGKDGRVDRDKLRTLAVANGVWRDEYEGINPGLARMNVGNRLRAKAKRAERIRWRGGSHTG